MVLTTSFISSLTIWYDTIEGNNIHTITNIIIVIIMFSIKYVPV